MTDIGSYAVCLIFGRMSRSHRIRPISRVTQPANLSQPPLSLSGEKEGWARGKSFIKPLEGLCASCHLPEGLVSWLGLPPWYGMVGVPTTSLGHRQHQSAEGEKRTIWLPTTCTDAHIVHNSFFAKLHHKRQKRGKNFFQSRIASSYILRFPKLLRPETQFRK